MSLPGSGRDATTAFLGGTGDVIMAYENEAILAAQNGEGFEYVYPDTTLLIENAGAILEDATPVAQDWLEFVLSDEGQTQFALTGFRPIRDDVDYGGTVEGAADPSNPFPEVGHAAHGRRGLRWLGRGDARSSSTRRTAWSPRRSWPPATRSSDRHRMTSVDIATRSRPARSSRRSAPRSTLTRSAGLGLGIAMLWFSLLVLIPLCAVVVTAAEGGWAAFWATVTNPQTAAAIRLTVLTALGVTVVNVVMGPIIAWVLVRDRFWGKSVLEVLIDIPFALPTIVAGLVLLSLYGQDSAAGHRHRQHRDGRSSLALPLRHPAVRRAQVQPVLEELDSDVEEAAASLGASRFTTFRRVILPSLTPAIAAGAALSFARAVGEYGSLVLLSGNLPFRTEVTSVRILSNIENDNVESAASVAVVLLVISLAVIVAFDVIQRRVAARG